MIDIVLSYIPAYISQQKKYFEFPITYWLKFQ